MLGRRGKADPGRHPVRAAAEAAENRFRVRQEQEIDIRSRNGTSVVNAGCSGLAGHQ